MFMVFGAAWFHRVSYCREPGLPLSSAAQPCSWDEADAPQGHFNTGMLMLEAFIPGHWISIVYFLKLLE